MRRLAVTATLAFCAAFAAGPVQAQTASPPRVEISAGALFAGGQSLGDSSADLIQNQSGGPAYPLFTSSTEMDAAPALEVRAGFRLSRVFMVEAGVLASRPRMSSRLSEDVEGVPDATIEQELSRYILDGALVARLPAMGRAVPFLRIGAGYLRELHEGDVLVETGTAIHGGGGLTFWSGAERFGLRLEGRVYALSGGVDFDDGGTRMMAAGGGSIVFAF